jgi:predicted ArsR family transcriptional regulator
MRNRTIEIELDKEKQSTKQIIIKYLKKEKDPVPLRFIYQLFAGEVNQRGIRQHIYELTTEGIIKKVRCPCHISFLYTI